MQILPISKEQNKNIFFLLLTFIISLSLVLISFIGSTTYAAVPTVSLALPSTGTQEPVFDINVTFSEEVSGVDIADFRFVDSSTSAEKGSIINVTEYDDSGFLNATTDSSTTDTTALTGQYFKVTVASDFGILSTDSNSFEVLEDSTTRITSTSTTEEYAASTTDIIAVTVDSTTRPTVSSIAIDNSDAIQNAVFGINVTFSEVVSGVDIADFRFVESSTDTEKGSIINVAEYDDSSFLNATTDSSTTDTTALTGQYFKVTVASDFGILSTDSNSFEILVDSTDPITSASTYFSYSTITDTLAVVVQDSTALPTVSSIAIDNTDTTQEASFGINIAFSEEVSGVDIVDFRFVESGTDTKKGHIVNVAEYDDSGFLNATTDSSTINSITTLTGQYFKVTVAADSNLLPTDSNSFEVVVDTDTPIRSTATYFSYITTTDTLAVAVDSTVSTPIISFNGTDINSGSTIYTNQDEISLTASSLETDSTLHITKGTHVSGRIGSTSNGLIRPDKHTFRFPGKKDVYGTGTPDSYIKLTNSSDHTNIRSISFWADPDDDVNTSQQRWVNIAIIKSGTQYDIVAGRDAATDGVVSRIRSGTSTSGEFKYSANDFSFFDRHHYVFIYTNSTNGSWKLYIDGVSVDPTGNRPTATPGSRDYNSPYFGKVGPGTNNHYYTGDLQNLIISKNVFSSGIVNDLYNGGAILDNAPNSILNGNLWYTAGISVTPTTLVVDDIDITTASNNTTDFKLISVSSDPTDPAIVTNINPNDDTNIFVTQIDAFGNESNSSRIVVIHDNESPSTTPTINLHTNTPNPNIPGNSTIEVSGAENDAIVTVTATHNTELDINNNPLQVINTRTGNGNVILNLSTLGTWKIKALQTDLAGNDSSETATTDIIELSIGVFNINSCNRSDVC